MKPLPGVRLNFGKRGIGISAGVPGFRVGVDSRGKGYTSTGIPGTGLSVRKYAKGSNPQTQETESAFAVGLLIGFVVIAVLVLLALVRAH
jgi:hypothetical protein